MSKLQIGDCIPSFSLKNQEGEDVSISAQDGRARIIYFYPKNETKVCTAEACNFRDWYDEFLPKSIQRPARDSKSKHCFHLYQLGLPNKWNRDTLVNYLKDWNIGSSVHFIPLHEHPHYRSNVNEFEGCKRISDRNLSLPMDPGLNIADIKYICSVISQFGESF